METIDPISALNEACEAMTGEQERRIREVMSFIADTWSLWVVHVLAEQGRLRFSRLQAQVEGISQKMLTKTLRQLEASGLVSRTMYMEVPPRVEYELTGLGRELILQFAPLWQWLVANVDRIAPTPPRQG